MLLLPAFAAAFAAAACRFGEACFVEGNRASGGSSFT